MTAIHRRAMLGVMLGGAAAATMGIAVLMPGPAESAPLTIAAGRAVETENPVEKAVWVRGVASGCVLVAPGTSSVPLAPCAPLAPPALLLMKAGGG
jgi:hypothetical protein